MLQHRVEQLAFGVARALARATPSRLFLAMGTGLGRVAYHLDRRHRAIALANLARAFPELAPTERKRMARACFGFFGRYVFDLLASIPAVPVSRLARFEVEGAHHAEAALAEGKGALFFSGHFGGWEFMAITHAWRMGPGALLARRLDNPHLEALLAALRTSTGNELIEKREAIRPTLKALRAGKGVAILMDQNVSSPERVFVDFFGHPAATTPALALLHLKTGAPLVPVTAMPLGGDVYRFIYGPRVEVEPMGDRVEDVRRITAACTRVLEEQIRARPECWLWMHRRWKTQPDPSD